MSFDVLQNLKDLVANHQTSDSFDVNTATFSGASGGSLFGSNESITSGESTNQIIDYSRQLEVENSLSKTSLFNNLQINNRNLENLGLASLDISKALNDNIAIREKQREETFASINGLADIVASINERVSGQLQDLGQAVTDVSKAQDGTGNPLDFMFKNPILFGLGAGGLAVAGVALLLVLRR